MPLKTYTSDDGCDMARLPLFFIFALPCSIILAILYQLIAYYMPCIGWVTALLMMGYAGGMFLILNTAGEMARNRNMWIHLTSSFIVAGIAYYVCWVTFFTLLFQDATAEDGTPYGLVWNPVEIAFYLPRFADVGYSTGSMTSSCSSHSSEISGVFLWICWVIEAVIIFIVPPFIAVGYTSNPFFPASNSWGTKRKIKQTYQSETAPRAKDAILADETFGWMSDLRPGDGVDALGFEFIEHPKEDLAYLSVTKGVEKVENKKRVIKQESVVEFIELSPSQRKQIEQYMLEMDARTELSPDTDAAAPEESLEAAATTPTLSAPTDAVTDGAATDSEPASASPAAPPKPPAKLGSRPGTKEIGDEWDQ
ncbi:MAG TPA: hypothetical protein VL860_13165 [Planctomycetota bacterium]|nr:hypothetical protein [Planctomycetota bacterium]